MKKANQKKNLSSDRALINPNDDRLGYAPFAKHLANCISTMSPTDGLVVAIHGPWGSGKSTVLNFILQFLRKEISKGKIIHIQFNPWLYSGTDVITRKFFDQIIAVLAKKKSISKKLRAKIANFADLISETPIPYSSVGKPISKLVSIKEKDIVSLKEDVESLLRSGQSKILVTIDDIDRLSSEEHRQVFQLIKAVANFPNIIYLLAFDKEVATKSLAQVQGFSGEEYLEKIVQVPFELPLPDKVSLRQLLFENIDNILNDSSVVLFDSAYWTNVYFEGIDHFIKTPRDIVRLTNTLSVTYKSVSGEVNPVDFIAIETLRIFCPIAYDIIRRHPESFTGVSSIGYLSQERQRFEEFHKRWIDQLKINDRLPVDKLLKRIFPKLKSNYGFDFDSECRRKLRVCNTDKYPIYFRLSVPQGMISNAEMMAFIQTSSDKELFSQELIRFSNEKRVDGSTRVREILEYLEDYIEDQIPKENILPILKAFFSIGDQLLKPEDERRGFFEFGNSIRIIRNVSRLLKRVEENTRYEYLRDAFTQGNAFAIMEDLLVVIGQQHGKWTNDPPESEEDRLVNEDHFKELENIALNKIRAVSKTGELLKSRQLPSILYRWKDWSSEDEVKQWAKDATATDAGLVSFLEQFLQKSYSQTLGDLAQRTIYRLDPKFIEPFLDPASIVDRVKNLISKDGFSENQLRVLQQLIKEYAIRAKGKNPQFELRKIDT